MVYDYRELGGGRMVLIRDTRRDHCEGSAVETICYGPLDPPPPRQRGRGGTDPVPPVPPPALPTPEEIAEQTIVNLPLPHPDVRIQPGQALTGLRAFLETGNAREHDFGNVPTVLGPLRVTATSDYVVDWGDGTVTGPHESTGGPYPDGDISHVYLHEATVDVTVTQRWTASWRLRELSGTVSGLRTVDVLEDFPVGQVQAVRQR